MVRRVLAALASVAVVATVAGPARAHTAESGTQMVWFNGHKCVKVNGRLGHPWSGPTEMHIYARVDAEQTYATIGCNQSWRVGSGGLRVTFELLVHKPAGTSVCRSLGYWYVNHGFTADYLAVTGKYGPRPCGRYTYSLRTRGQVHWNGAWRGGSVTSPGHYFG
jgi:hypothetical protein